ncbi:MAG: sigma 54-interacting transcriptional regulator, partial [Desulfobacterales bacterium]|nr:sigma 54-interacting transcriptional regulator [Desulfobacterales bacterium]
LAEISEMPREAQAKLLRVLQEGQFERLGSASTINVDVRIIAASNLDLTQAVRDGRFRDDLYYRLNVSPIIVPPLRERHDDIPLLVWSFVKEFSKKMRKNIVSIPRKTMEAMQQYSWPGNVRELRNVVERAVILSNNHVLLINIPEIRNSTCMRRLTLNEMEKEYIAEVLSITGGRVRGENGAAAILGLKPTTLDSRMKKLGILK